MARNRLLIIGQRLDQFLACGRQEAVVHLRRLARNSLNSSAPSCASISFLR
jgi:hypothetical protein